MLPLPSPLSNSYSTISRAESFADDAMDDSAGHNQSSTLPRILDGREYDGRRIDSCFTLYVAFEYQLFGHYP